MSPTVLRVGPYRFFFFSREEARPHVHVESPDGEVKYWLEPEVALARNYGVSGQELRKIHEIIVERYQEIRDAWRRHFET